MLKSKDEANIWRHTHTYTLTHTHAHTYALTLTHTIYAKFMSLIKSILRWLTDEIGYEKLVIILIMKQKGCNLN